MPKNATPLAANISHDFRTPLTVIKEYAAIIGDGLVGPLTPEQREFLKVIQDRADDLALLIDNMLDLSKAQSGRLGVWRREMSLAEILGRLAVVLQHKAQLRKVSLEVVVADNLPTVYADAEKIERAISNLFADAVKHCPDQSRLVLWARLGDAAGEVVIGLCDNRPDFAAEELHALRLRLLAARQAVCRGKGGGVGLRSVCRLVEAHFGRVDCDLSAEGGACCFFTLPVRAPSGLIPCWLRSAARHSDPSAVVSLWSIQTATPVQPGSVSVVDEFLQNAFRHGELIVCGGPQRWFLVSLRATEKMPSIVQRVQRRWTQVIGKRWTVAMPRLVFTPQGVWPVAQSLEIVRQLENDPCDSQMLAGI